MRNIRFMIFVAALTGFSYVQAQQKTDSVFSAPTYHPMAGNIGIGLDAMPVFNFIGNLFSGSTAINSLNISMPSIYAKYYLTDNSAIRGVLNISNTSTTTRQYVRDDAAYMQDSRSQEQTIDRMTSANNNMMLSLAYQQFVGKNRLRGFYGAQLLGGFASTKDTYAYGNPMTDLNPTPSSGFAYVNGNQRKLVDMRSRNLLMGVGGLAGVEYYILPRLCVGGEVSLNAIYTKGLQSYTQTEKVQSGQRTTIDTAVAPGDNGFAFQTASFTPGQNIGLYVMFHF